MLGDNSLSTAFFYLRTESFYILTPHQELASLFMKWPADADNNLSVPITVDITSDSL